MTRSLPATLERGTQIYDNRTTEAKVGSVHIPRFRDGPKALSAAARANAMAPPDRRNQ
ncbi:hypothetical protein [Streptomyces antarcticus]|uniref:hypothetical protein n=1 Tax=Streptomyces antarcticus TaxID=2996458 RepID=UPI00226F104D|nr:MULTISPECIES: hypothetical protein [unclassified Streptomyces]MCY0940272.1 hypothetical protein [Streptomyces sp. H34-AA3]MCZ4080919.1 hypothetical protein [Streptomyces sp. H34-S5]